ncbi:hypothetical protein E4U49_003701 [Claviceps purpurea]|nr:hypothetical protein E4U49_003701 [Claviceps purpurea]
MASVLRRKAADRSKSLLGMILKERKFARSIVVLVFKATRLRLSRTSHKPGSVVLISAKICIKSNSFTRLVEAEAMVYVSRSTSIPVPRVYSAFEYKQRVYIVMERIHGQPLSVDWVQRSSTSKAKILEQLRLVADEMRKIEVPEDAGVSDICGGPIYDPRLPGRSHWGPFPSISAFHRQLRNGIVPDDIRDPESIPQDLRELFLFHQQLWRKPVFTHGDLSSLNILAKGDEVVGILDWETAARMPCYWEYTAARDANPQNLFWLEEVDKFLTPNPQAWEAEAIRKKYFGDL